MKVLNIEQVEVPASKLKRHPENPRKGNVERIKESIEANGFWGTVVVQKSTGHILAGNHRVMAVQELEGDDVKVPVVYVDVSDEQARKILVADNRISDIATTDPMQLNKLLMELSQVDDGLVGLGYDEGYLDRLLGDTNAYEPILDPVSSSKTKVTQSQIDKKKDDLENRYVDDPSNAKAMVQILCPHCAEEFEMNEDGLIELIRFSRHNSNPQGEDDAE